MHGQHNIKIKSSGLRRHLFSNIYRRLGRAATMKIEEANFFFKIGRLVNPLQLELPDDRKADDLQITRFHKNRIPPPRTQVYAATRDVLGSALTSPAVTTNAIAMNNKADQNFNYGTKYH